MLTVVALYVTIIVVLHELILFEWIVAYLCKIRSNFFQTSQCFTILQQVTDFLSE